MSNTPPSTPALELRQVSKSFGTLNAVQDLSFSIAKNEIFALLGPNGAGKSTTISMISGLVRLGQGEIRIFAKDVVQDFEFTRRLTGVMPQEIVIDNFFTVENSLKIHAGYYGYPDDPKWRNTLIERLALAPFLKKKPIQLSGGTKRRLMLAKALIHKPRLLILDEPTAGVDVELRHNIWNFVREINQAGTTILLTTHYLEEAEEMCDRIAIMSGGRLVALEKTRDLLTQVEDKKLQVFLGQGPTQASPQLLQEFRATFDSKTRELMVPLKAHMGIDPVLSAIKSEGFEILDLNVRKSDLEDVFLTLTRKDAPHAR